MNVSSEVRNLFYQLADLNREQQSLYFREHPTDATVQSQVQELLANDYSTDYDLRKLVQEPAEALLNNVQAATGGWLCGPYRLLKQIGQGGMSEVWLASRVDQLVKRNVALKLPSAGIHAARFAEHLQRERDVLANLVHPGIARLYDAGIAEGGRPFIAMEFVEGTSLSAYCDTHQLPIRQRLTLFLQILHAIHYAHSRLVIHRDLKPSNIMVTGDGEVKLLDFGIAKLMVEGEGPNAAVTELGGRALTLAYASPEQVLGQQVTTASDVFSLGVILYELLSGARPFVPKRDSRAAMEEAILIAAKADIREELDRLGAHVVAARALLAEGGPVGRRLDFLAQEFGREANTLCAKANDASLTQQGLELRVQIEQLREQVQNIE